MIYVPDLFGSYVKGEQQAIQDNWTDLKNYEEIERARTQNDAANLDLQLAQWDFGNQIAQQDAAGTQAAVQEQVDIAGAPGKILSADMDSRMTGSQHSAYMDWEPEIAQLVSDTVVANINAGDFRNQVSNVQTNAGRAVLPQNAYALQRTLEARAKDAAAAADSADANREDLFKTGRYLTNTGAINASMGNIDAQYTAKNIQPIALDNKLATVKLQGTSIGNEQVVADGYQAERAKAIIAGLQQEAFTYRQNAQLTKASGGSDEEVAALLNLADARAAQAENLAISFEQNNGFGEILGGKYGSGVTTSYYDVGRNYVQLDPSIPIGSPVDMRNQYEAELREQERRAAEAAQYEIDLAKAQAEVASEMQKIKEEQAGGGQTQSRVVQTGEVNPYKTPNKLTGAGPYEKGTPLKLTTSSGAQVSGKVLGEVTKSNGTFIMVQLPGERIIHVPQWRLNEMTTGNRNTTPADVIRPGATAPDIASNWLMPGNINRGGTRPTTSAPKNSGSLFGPGTQEYLLQKNPRGFN